MYAGYFTVNASVGGRFAGVAADVVDGEADGDAAGEPSCWEPQRRCSSSTTAWSSPVGSPAVWTSPPSPPVNLSTA